MSAMITSDQSFHRRGPKGVTKNRLREHNAFARLHDRARMNLHHDPKREHGIPRKLATG